MLDLQPLRTGRADIEDRDARLIDLRVRASTRIGRQRGRKLGLERCFCDEEVMYGTQCLEVSRDTMGHALGHITLHSENNGKDSDAWVTSCGYTAHTTTYNK